MEQFKLSCEFVEPHKLAIILSIFGVHYIVDPQKMSFTTRFQSPVIGYLNENGLYYEQIPLTVSSQEDKTYEIKLYSDYGSESLRVKSDEWDKLGTTAMYQLCHRVLFEDAQTIYLAEDYEPLSKAEFWETLYSLLIWDLPPRYQQALVDDMVGYHFECTLLSEPEDPFQELFFRFGNEEWKTRWSDCDFEVANLTAIRKRMELALDAQVFDIGLPGEKHLSCKHLDARGYYFNEADGKWEFFWDSYKSLVSLSNNWDVSDGIAGVCNPITVIPVLYQCLLEIATRFDKYTNHTSRSFRAQLFSSEIEEYIFWSRARANCEKENKC